MGAVYYWGWALTQLQSWWWGGACTRHSLFVGGVGGGLKINKKGGGGRMGEREWVEVGGWMGLGQFCVVMTTSCAIRTHSVTIRTTQGSCRVSAKQPR